MVKLIHLTDPHLVPPGRSLYDLDTAARFTAAVEHIQVRHADAEACIITGDLAHRGHTEAYALLRELLKPLSVPVLPLIGNHDHRQRFCAAFPEVPRDTEGFVQWVQDVSAGRLILLDTVMRGDEPGPRAAGYFGSERIQWLRERLDEAENLPVYLFMHHPPFGIGAPALDRINLEPSDAQTFGEILQGRDNVRHLFFGHIHRTIFGSWRGLPFSTLSATAHQSLLDLKAAEDLFTHEPPAYGVVLLDTDQVTIHTENYLHRGPIYHPDGRCVSY